MYIYSVIVPRKQHIANVMEALTHTPVVAIIGARQVGKTTLAREIAKEYGTTVTCFDLEDPDDLARLAEPKLALQNQTGLIIIDEIQRRPDLFPVLRVLVDRPDDATRFLILGSAAPDLLKQSSESLAGRILYYALDGFDLGETGIDDLDKLWLRGGFPRSFLAPSLKVSYTWRKSFIQTFLERDIPQLGFHIPASTLHRFWGMLAHYHAQTWNGNELARAFGISHTAVRRYLDLLTGSLVVWQLQPWHANLGKRQVKSPKVYISDSGLLHTLLGIRTNLELERHPKIGASWEGYVLKEILRRMKTDPSECFFWATHAGAELDLLIVRGEKRIGFEIKRTTAPSVTPSMRISIKDLKLEKLVVIHAGEQEFRLHDHIEAVPLKKLGMLKIGEWK